MKGFTDAFCNFIENKVEGITKGSNLFAFRNLDASEVTSGNFGCFLVSSTTVEGASFEYYDIEIRILTARSTSRESIDEASSVMSSLRKKRGRIASDAGDIFWIKDIVPNDPGVVTSEKQDNGLYLAEASMTVKVVLN